MRKLIVAFVLGVLLVVTGDAVQQKPHANCCLCMCHAKDETTCSRMCIRLQHSKQIVEEPEMNVCTQQCLRVHVEQTK